MRSTTLSRLIPFSPNPAAAERQSRLYLVIGCLVLFNFLSGLLFFLLWFLQLAPPLGVWINWGSLPFYLVAYLLARRGHTSASAYLVTATALTLALGGSFMAGFGQVSYVLFGVASVIAALLINQWAGFVLVFTSAIAFLVITTLQIVNGTPSTLPPLPRLLVDSVGLTGATIILVALILLEQRHAKNAFEREQTLNHRLQCNQLEADQREALNNAASEHRLHLATSISEIIQALSKLDEPDLIWNHATQMICDRLDYSLTSIYLFDETGQNEILQASFSKDDQQAPIIDLNLPLRLADRSIGHILIQSSRPGDFSSEETILLQELADRLAATFEYASLRKKIEEMDQLGRHAIVNAWQRIPLSAKELSATSSMADLLPEPCNISSFEAPLIVFGQTIGSISLDTERSAWTQEEQALIQTISDQAALMLEHARLFDENYRQVQAHKKAADISSLLLQQSRPSGILEIAVGELRQALQIAGVAGSVAPPPGEVIHPPAYQLIAKDPLDLIPQPTSAYPQLPSLAPYQEWPPSPLEPSGFLLFISPLPGKVAYLFLEFRACTEPHYWNREERLLIEQVASHLALTLHNAFLIEQIQARAAELALVRKVSLETTQEARPFEDLLEVIAQRTQQLTSSHRVDVWLWIDDEESLALTTIYPDDGVNSPGRRMRPNEDLPGRAYNQKKTLVSTSYLAGDAPCGPALAIPLPWQGRIVGVLVSRRQPDSPAFTAEQEHLAELFACHAASVIQSVRLEIQTQAALTEIETLYQAGAELNAASTYQDALDVLRKYTLLGHPGASQVILFRFDQPSSAEQRPQWLIPVARWAGAPVEIHYPERLSINTWPAADQILHPDLPTFIEEVNEDPRLSLNERASFIENMGAQSIVAAPLNVAGQWIGHILAVSQTPILLTEQDIRRLISLSGQAASTIQNIHLLEETRRRAEQLQTAAEIARDTSSTLALDILLQRTVHLIYMRFGYDHASILLLDESGQNAVVREATGEAGPEMKQSLHQVQVGGNTIVGTVTSTGQPILVNDLESDNLYLANPFLPHMRAELCLPLKISDRVIGALDVQSKRPNIFTADDTTVLQVLADQVTIAVENARAYALEQKALEDMREVDRLKSQFLAHMSHELRTPLNSIIGFSRVILKGIDGPITDVQHQDLTAIYNAGQHLLGLINDVLDLSKIEAGKMVLAFEDQVNLVELCQGVLSTTAGLLKDKPIQLESYFAPDLPKVRADPLKIRQILLNLLSNAAKFTEEGSIRLEAEMQTDPQGQAEVILRVIDSGPGIAPKDQSKLFQAFTQLESSQSRKPGGTGLGLSICRHLVEMHGGRIGIISDVGKGSTFYFTLPLPALQDEDSQT